MSYDNKAEFTEFATPKLKVADKGLEVSSVDLLSDDIKTKLQNGEDISVTGLPPCHINFDNLGKLDFSLDLLSPQSMNLKIFNKINVLSDIIRNINNKLIAMIMELQCCDMATTYNNNVIPIFESLLTDFVNNIIEIAKGLSHSQQVFNIILCAVKPVYGNPWLGSGGTDWLSPMYSYLNGFDDIYNWIMDGTILDIIINPISSFSESIDSCSGGLPVTITYDDIAASQENISGEFNTSKKVLEDYFAATSKAANSHQDVLNNDKAFQEYELFKKEQQLLIIKVSRARTQVSIIKADKRLKETEELDKIEVDEELNPDQLKVAIDQLESAELELLTLNTKNKKFIKIDADVRIANTSSNKIELDIASDTMINSELSLSILQKITKDKHDPSCSCLTAIMGLGLYKPPEYVTVSTYSDVVNKLVDRIHTIDKDKYNEAISKLGDGDIVESAKLSNLYISLDNLAEKYSKSNKSNKSIDRDNMKTFEILIDDLSYDDVNMDYNFIDKTGWREDNSINIPNINNIKASDIHLYVDSGREGDSPHLSSNINTIFELNDKRQKYLIDIRKLLSKAHSEKRYYDKVLNNYWNIINRHINKTITDIKSVIFSENSMIGFNFEATTVFSDELSVLNFEKTKLGVSYDIISFIKMYHDTTILTLPGTKIYDNLIEFPDMTFNGEMFSEVATMDLSIDIELWETSSKTVGQLEALIIRVENLIKLDNVVVEVVGTGVDTCGCDIICKLIQYIIDIILSAITNIAKHIINRILKAIMNEHIAFIIDTVLHFIKCGTMVTEFQDNIDTITNLAKGMIEDNKKPLTKMIDIKCDIDNQLSADEISAIVDNEIKLEEDVLDIIDDGIVTISDTTLAPPNPTYGEIVNVTPESNTIKLTGNLIVSGNEIEKGRNIPTIAIDCEISKGAIEIDYTDKSATLIVTFVPDSKIEDYEVNEIDLNPIKQDNLIDNIELDKKLEEINSLSDMMKDINSKLKDSVENDIYLEDPSCDTKDSYSSDSTLKLCDEENLEIYNIDIIKDDVVVDNSNLYGVLIKLNTNPHGFKEYNPDHKLADLDGYVIIPDGDSYYKYSIPDQYNEILPQYVATEVKEEYTGDDKADGDIDYNTEIYYNSYNGNKHTIVEQIIYEFKLEDDILYKYTKLTLDETITHYFRYFNLEFLIQFKNKVNRLDIRGISNVLGYEDNVIAYNIENYIGRYLNTANLFNMSSTDSTTYYISEQRIYELSQILLTENYMISNKLAVIDSVIEHKNSNDPDTCLLPEDKKELLINSDQILAGVNEIVENINNDNQILIEKLNKEKVNEEIITDPNIYKESMPFIVLNKENNILIQIIESKITLQFKESAIGSKPFIIDHKLVAGKQYTFSFTPVNEFSFTMQLIDYNGRIHNMTEGFNSTSNILYPSIIGANADYSRQFCGQIVDTKLVRDGSTVIDAVKISEYNDTSSNDSNILIDGGLASGGIIFNTANATKDLVLRTSLSPSLSNGMSSILNYNLSNVSSFGRYTIAYNMMSLKNSDELLEDNLYTNDLEKIPASEQTVNYYGTIKRSNFFQAIDGYLDGFFCKDNLIETSFTIGFWIYPKSEYIMNANKRIILSDDINQNYIYYDTITSRFIIDFYNETTVFIDHVLVKWTYVTFERFLYLGNYKLTIHQQDDIEKHVILNTSSNFMLMSMGAEYVWDTKKYENEFEGYIASISIFFKNITDKARIDMFNKQGFMVQGLLENLI